MCFEVNFCCTRPLIGSVPFQVLSIPTNPCNTVELVNGYKARKLCVYLTKELPSNAPNIVYLFNFCIYNLIPASGRDTCSGLLEVTRQEWSPHTLPLKMYLTNGQLATVVMCFSHMCHCDFHVQTLYYLGGESSR